MSVVVPRKALGSSSGPRLGAHHQQDDEEDEVTFVVPDKATWEEEEWTPPTLAQLEEEYWEGLDETEREILVKTRAGKAYLKMGQLDDAMTCFDTVRDLSHGSKYLWQRGLTLFYLERYGEAADDLGQNAELYETKFHEPATEERLLWAAALAKAGSKEDVLTWSSDLPRENRIVFRLAVDMFRGDADPVVLKRATAEDDAFDPMRRNMMAHYYTGLYWDAIKNDPHRAAAHMLRAKICASLDKNAADDIMCSIPNIHLNIRGWDPNDVDDDAIQRANNFI